ncbi:MAG: phytoene/squalene synthase family protein [Bdellovibrionales bacterium]
MSNLEAQNIEVLNKHAKTFYMASLFLGKEDREDAALLYRFAREVDDIVDEGGFSNTQEVIHEIHEGLHSGSSNYDYISSFNKRFTELEMPFSYADELIKGVSWDIDNSYIQTERDLLIYCYRVAGVVGLMMCAALKINDSKAWAFAIDLGMGMQLTNISRDVLEDLVEKDRVYLPAEMIEAYANRLAVNQPHQKDTSKVLRKTTLNSDLMREAVIDLTEYYLLRAEAYYESAENGLHYIPFRARFAILVAARVYRAIGLKILKNRGSFLKDRVFVTKTEKLILFVKCCFLFFTPKIMGWKVVDHNTKLHHDLAGLPGVKTGVRPLKPLDFQA